MHLSYNTKPHRLVDYCPLPSGKVDVFLRKNERVEENTDGETVYVAEEVYFQVDSDIIESEVTANFDFYWSQTGVSKPSDDERLKALEQAMLEILLGGNT